MIQRRWIYKSLANTEKLKILFNKLQIPTLLGEIIYSRGYETIDQIDSFLFPNLKDIRDPYQLRKMKEAVFLLNDSIINKRRIIILGDYDVDGITATAMMVEFLRKCGVKKLDFFIPNRIKHGYGLTGSSTEILLDMRPDLVITVDNGITAGKEVKRLNDEGVSTIVTDHHLSDNQMLPSGIVINPNHPECNYPFKQISGCGVALKLIMALRKFFRETGFWNEKIPEPNLRESLDLVAMGTIGDVVSLSDENRILTYHGINLMNEKPRISIKILKELKKVDKITSRTIGFKFAPLLNAAGRLQDANIAVKFLLTEDEKEARAMAKILNEANLKRREKELEMLNEAQHLCEKQKDNPAIVIASPHFHEGINGIVATRLMERYYKPVIILTEYKNNLKGSSRSIPEFHIKDALSKCEDLLERFGGHATAAGCSLTPKNFDAFKERFFSICKVLIPDKIQPKLEINGILELSKISENFVEQHDRLQPFGEGNQEPFFEIVAPKEPFKLLKNKHIKWTIKGKFDILGWDLADSFLKRTPSKLVVNLGFNDFAGMRKIQITIKDAVI